MTGYVKDLLEEKARKYETPGFIDGDPIQVPHSFSEPANIEISGLFSAMLAWGRRDISIRSSFDLISRMEGRPIDFLLQMEETGLENFLGFRHRTFDYEDCIFFIRALQRIYRKRGGLYSCFLEGYSRNRSIGEAILNFRREFLETGHSQRSRKHLPDPSRNSAAKRINLFLRWMVRSGEKGVDFGLWKEIDPADLLVPLDVHTAGIARQLGLLKRKQNDWKAVEELTAVLRELDPSDPVKYDYALFGMGIYEKA